MTSKLKIGILGGGQLGKMLIESARESDLKHELNVLEPDANAPCRNLADNFDVGDFTDFDTVVQFGKRQDVVTIEIEKVNADALQELEYLGIKVIPPANVVKTIQDKGLQKQFLKNEGIPTASFQLCESELPQDIKLPIVQKLRTGGYDGYGVNVLKTSKDLKKAFKEPSILEEAVNIKKELSIIVARNESGQISTFDVVEMHMDPKLNLVDLLFAPADVSDEIKNSANRLAEEIATKLELVGILAIELFLDQNDKLLVNEMAPRPHNSGHHTIEAAETSQYKQLLNCLTGSPLESAKSTKYGVMINILGEDGYQGSAKCIGTEKLKNQDIFLHLYNKAETRPGRKMGHITAVAEDLASALKKAKMAASTIKIIS